MPLVHTTKSALDAIQTVIDSGFAAAIAAQNTANGWTLSAPGTWMRDTAVQTARGNETPVARLYIASHAGLDMTVGGSQRDLEVGLEIAMGTTDVASDATPSDLADAIRIYGEAVRVALVDDLDLGRSGSVLKAAGVWDVTQLTIAPLYVDGHDPSTSAAYTIAHLSYSVLQSTETRTL